MCLQAQDDNDFPEIIHTSRHAIYALLIRIKAHTIVQTMWEECFSLEIITHNQKETIYSSSKIWIYQQKSIFLQQIWGWLWAFTYPNLI